MLKFIKEIVIERLGKDAFVKMLNIPVNRHGETILYIAAENNKPKVVQFLMAWEECDHTIASKYRSPISVGGTPLHIAAKKCHLQVVKILLEASRFSKDEKKKMEYLEMQANEEIKAIDLARTYENLEVVEVSLNARHFKLK